MKSAIFFILCIALASSVILKRQAFRRLIPADKLRDFPLGCFASTQCRVFNRNESWSLAPFCGMSRCTEVDQDGTKILAEEVFDCGPLIDLEKSPGCVQVALDDEEKEAPFPDCCPKYDCEENSKVEYVKSDGAAAPKRPKGNPQKSEPRALE